MLLCFGLIPAGILKTAVMPKMDSIYYQVKLELEKGTPVEHTEDTMRKIAQALNDAGNFYQNRDGINPIDYNFLASGGDGSNKGELVLQLLEANEGREVPGEVLIDTWRVYVH